MKYLRFLLCACLMLFLSGTITAQQQRATINEEGKIVLPADVPLTDVYTIDIAADAFDSHEELMAYFNERSASDVNFRILRDRNEVMVILSTKNHPDRTTSQWSARLSEVADFQEVSPITKTK